MPQTLRKIVRIDEGLCDGCGLCVTPCAEGAIEIVNGKAKVVKDELCDGAGFCLAVCPHGALSIEERLAEDFDHAAAQTRVDEPRELGRASDISCERCGAGEHERVLMACRTEGRSTWVCVRCLPALIHG